MFTEYELYFRHETFWSALPLHVAILNTRTKIQAIQKLVVNSPDVKMTELVASTRSEYNVFLT